MKARSDPCRVGIVASLDIGSDHSLDALSRKGFWRHGSLLLAGSVTRSTYHG
jgi:hypothetical protein